MVRALQQGDVEEFSALLKAFVLESMSYFDFTERDPERVYQAFMLGLLTHMEETHTFRSEREAGLGRADLLIIPKRAQQLGIILELKRPRYNESLEEAAAEALDQIEAKGYKSAFADRACEGVLAIGIAFHKKEMAVASRVC